MIHIAPSLDANEAAMQSLLRQLVIVWADFDSRLSRVPLIQKLERGQLRIEDYRQFLLNHRQQVIEGARWIARAASSVSQDYAELRSTFLRHAVTEHRDYRMLEENFVAAGGQRAEIEAGEKNIGTEAFSAWMFHRATQPNPFDLLGAMFIIEGLGQNKAGEWGQAIQTQLALPDEAVSFLKYHSANDENHMEQFEQALMALLPNESLERAIVKTAKVTARLYLLQLEELGNY